MGTARYDVTLGPVPGALSSSHLFRFGRINVILGANGSGKTTVMMSLRQTKSRFPGLKKVVTIEGGRVVTVPESFAIDRQTFQTFEDLEGATNQLTGERLTKLSERLHNQMRLLARLEEQQHVRHSKAILLWRERGRKGEEPTVAESPLVRLKRAFEAIFPEITLLVDASKKRLQCVKAGSPYSPSLLSDGERQVFGVLVDLLVLGTNDMLVLIDEPELNLNAKLAARVWATLESEFPDSVFIYATHSMEFASRETVEVIVLLGGPGEPPRTIEDAAEIPSGLLEDFLGNAIQLLGGGRYLVLEGQEGSDEEQMFEWLLGRSISRAVAVGNCDEVARVVDGAGLWARFGMAGKCIGVIDRDYWPDSRLRSLARPTLTVLPLHEFESLFVHPDVLLIVSPRLRLTAWPKDRADIVLWMREKAKTFRHPVVSRRALARLGRGDGPRLSRKELSTVDSDEALTQKLVASAEVVRAETLAALDAKAVDAVVKEELAKFDAALVSDNLDELLRLCPGKPLLDDAIERLGLRNRAAFFQGIRAHIKPAEVPMLSTLAKEIQARYPADQSDSAPVPTRPLVTAPS